MVSLSVLSDYENRLLDETKDLSNKERSVKLGLSMQMLATAQEFGWSLDEMYRHIVEIAKMKGKDEL